MRPIRATRWDQFLGIALGSASFGFLLGELGAVSRNGWKGGIAGALLGGVLGWGAVVGRISPVLVGAIVFGVFGCAVGPGCDDCSGTLGMALAPIGALFAAVGWRRPRWFWKGLAPWNGDADRYSD